MSLADEPDDSLLRRARGGDFEAFCFLFRRHAAETHVALRNRSAVGAVFLSLHRQLGGWDLRETFADALARETSLRRTAPPPPDDAPPNDAAWDDVEEQLRAGIGAAPLASPRWVRWERWTGGSGVRFGAWAGVLAILGVSLYAAWPAFTVRPLPPFAATIVPVEELNKSPTPVQSRIPAGERLSIVAGIAVPGRGVRASFVVRLLAPSSVRALIVERNGKPIRVLAERSWGPGEHSIEWDGRDRAGRPCPTGTYGLQVTTDDWGERRSLFVRGD